MTRGEQVNAALTLLDPPPSELEAWQGWVEHTLDSLEWWCRVTVGFKAPGTKPGRAALRAYVKALHQVQEKYDALPPELRPWFSLAETAYIAGTPTAIERELTPTVTVIERELAKAEPLLDKEPPPPKRDAILGKAATSAAYRLLLRIRRREPSLTRGGEWERLSKVLSNGAPVFEHMRAFKHAVQRAAWLKDKIAPLTHPE